MLRNLLRKWLGVDDAAKTVQSKSLFDGTTAFHTTTVTIDPKGVHKRRIYTSNAEDFYQTLGGYAGLVDVINKPGWYHVGKAGGNRTKPWSLRIGRRYKYHGSEQEAISTLSQLLVMVHEDSTANGKEGINIWLRNVNKDTK